MAVVCSSRQSVMVQVTSPLGKFTQVHAPDKMAHDGVVPVGLYKVTVCVVVTVSGRMVPLEQVTE